MSDRQNWGGLGEQFKGALADALQSGDFTHLNDLVTGTVVNTLNEVGISFTSGNDVPPENKNNFNTSSREEEKEPSDAWEKERLRQQKLQQDWQKQMRRKQEEQFRRRQEQMQRQEEELRRSQEQIRRQKEALLRKQGQLKTRLTDLSLTKFKKVGNVSNVLYQVFGGIGFGATLFVTFCRILMYFFADTTLAGWIVNLFFLIFFGGMVRLGNSQGRRLKRARRYLQLCGEKMYGEIEHLAGSIGKSPRYVVKDLQKMLRLGMFPEGHLDTQKTCLMLSDTVYRQYLDAEEGRKKREYSPDGQEKPSQPVSEPEKSDRRSSSGQQEAPGQQESELDTMINEGMECIRKLRELNDKIPGEVISAKLFRLETLLKEIFERVREHPEQRHRMHKLMNYYLPTTLKLVETYEEFDRISSPGEEIISAKAEIENTLDTINQAFTELLNNLFQDAVFDATTDAQVLKTMLAREGLMNEMELSAAPEKN